jgi:hypothetical protein
MRHKIIAHREIVFYGDAQKNREHLSTFIECGKSDTDAAMKGLVNLTTFEIIFGKPGYGSVNRLLGIPKHKDIAKEFGLPLAAEPGKDWILHLPPNWFGFTVNLICSELNIDPASGQFGKIPKDQLGIFKQMIHQLFSAHFPEILIE